MPKGDKLPAKREAFCQAYAGVARGNATEALRIAGYSMAGSEVTRRAMASRIKDHPMVQARLRELAAQSPLIKSREQIQQFLSEVIDDANEEMRDRLKAAELLGKTIGAFTEKHEHKLEGGAAQVVIMLPDNGRGPGSTTIEATATSRTVPARALPEGGD